MPVLVLGVVSFLIFVVTGILGIWAVMKEHEEQEHPDRERKAHS